MSEDITPQDLMRLEPEIVRRWNRLTPEEKSQHILSGSTMYGAVELHRQNMRTMMAFFERKQTDPDSIAQLRDYLEEKGWK